MSKYFFISVLSLVSILFSQTVINGGNVQTTRWTKSNSPYQVYGDIEIPFGERLTIDPGVEVIFYGHYWMNVQGSLIAKGKSDEMIVFTSCDENTKWFSIRFIYTPENSPASHIEYCHISNARTIQEELPDDPDSYNKRHGGGIYLRDFSKVTIANCIIENNIAATGGGIGLMYSSPMIRDNIIRNNVTQGPSSSWGGGISIGHESDPIVKGNLIENNVCIGDVSYCGGSGIFMIDADPIILNNIVRYNAIINPNKAENEKDFDGAAFYIHTSNPQIIGNLIYDNSNNIDNGGGFWMYRCNSKIINNTIRSNHASNGGGFFLRESNPDFHNNIVRYNEVSGTGSQVYLDDNLCDPNFYNNNIQGGKEGFGGLGAGSYFTGAWINNIDQDPKYVGGVKEFSYKLSVNSSCIDAGNQVIPDFEYPSNADIAGNFRMWSTWKGSIDMGAYEFGAPAAVLQTPVNIETITDSGNIQLSWDSVVGALYYRVLSSDDNLNFEDDFSGSFNNCSWSTPVSKSKKFYRVVAVN